MYVIVFIHWHKTWAQVFQNSPSLLFTDHEMGRHGKKFTWGFLPNMLRREPQVFRMPHCFGSSLPVLSHFFIASANKGMEMRNDQFLLQLLLWRRRFRDKGSLKGSNRRDNMRCKFLSTAYPRQDLWATNPINIDELEGIKLTRG